MNDLVVPEAGQQLSVSQLSQQVESIKSAMNSVMKENIHYGTIQGCGDKKALLLPGAQKLGLLFNLAPEYVIDADNLPNEHREYEVTCKLTHRTSGNFIGQGVGVCSTMESKYRYRWDDTGKDVPQEYWDTRDIDLIGGPSFAVRKVNNSWKIYQKIPHDNPADYYNTAKKIAKKRAYNDAILTATAASDIFAPDDDNDPDIIDHDTGESIKQPQRNSSKSSPQGNIATEPQQKLIHAKLINAGITTTEFENVHGKIEELPFSSVNPALEWIKNNSNDG